MASQAPKFLLGGIKLSKNFLGTSIMVTAIYSGIESFIKFGPVLVIAYVASKYIYI